MTIYRFMPKEKYTKFDNGVMTIATAALADGAKVMYAYLASHMNGKRITHNYIKKALGISQGSIDKYVRQLKELDLILMIRTGVKQYECYIGSTQVPASYVKEMWKELGEEDAENPYTAEDIKRMQVGLAEKLRLDKENKNG